MLNMWNYLGDDYFYRSLRGELSCIIYAPLIYIIDIFPKKKYDIYTTYTLKAWTLSSHTYILIMWIMRYVFISFTYNFFVHIFFLFYIFVNKFYSCFFI